MSKFISVGKILNFHGIQGEAKVGYSKNQQEFFCGLKEVFVKEQQDYKPLKIKNIRLHNCDNLIFFFFKLLHI